MQKAILLVFFSLMCLSPFATIAAETPNVDLTLVNTSEENITCYSLVRVTGGAMPVLKPMGMTGCIKPKKRVSMNVQEGQFLVNFHWPPKQGDIANILVRVFTDHIETEGPIRARHHKTGKEGFKLTVFAEDHFHQ